MQPTRLSQFLSGIRSRPARAGTGKRESRRNRAPAAPKVGSDAGRRGSLHGSKLAAAVSLRLRDVREQVILSARHTRVAPAWFTLCLLLASSACSLVVDKNATQCTRDQDCRVAPFTSCSAGVCTDPKTSGAGGDGSCNDASGCYRCAPQTNVQFLNACADRSCVPFDNASRLRNLTADGKLKPLLNR